MSEFLNYASAWLEHHNGLHTAQEIAQQPDSWLSLYQQLSAQQTDWQNFLQPLLADPQLQIILTGAGSSDFISKTLAPWLRRQRRNSVQAYGTTDIVANPNNYLQPDKKTLLVSFARSGNSPESLATVELADQLITHCYHLIITCNPQGVLASYKQNSSRVCSLIMPSQANDKGFAMTSSFSCMLLTARLLLTAQPLEQNRQPVEQISQLCRELQSQWQPICRTLANQNFKRIIYVGSSCFKGLAEEGALKLLELTAGKVITRFDSSLGLRHGPKFSLDQDSLAVCLLSNQTYTRQYDLDLLHELQANGIAKKVLALSGITQSEEHILSCHCQLDDSWLIFPYLLFAQLLAFETSLALGITPDNPCPSGEVNRVVQGVTIYPFSLTQ